MFCSLLWNSVSNANSCLCRSLDSSYLVFFFFCILLPVLFPLNLVASLDHANLGSTGSSSLAPSRKGSLTLGAALRPGVICLYGFRNPWRRLQQQQRWTEEQELLAVWQQETRNKVKVCVNCSGGRPLEDCLFFNLWLIKWSRVCRLSGEAATEDFAMKLSYFHVEGLKLIRGSRKWGKFIRVWCFFFNLVF